MRNDTWGNYSEVRGQPPVADTHVFVRLDDLGRKHYVLSAEKTWEHMRHNRIVTLPGYVVPCGDFVCNAY